MSINIATRGIISNSKIDTGLDTIYIAHSIEPKSESLGTPSVIVEKEKSTIVPINSDSSLPSMRNRQIDIPKNNNFPLPSRQ